MSDLERGTRIQLRSGRALGYSEYGSSDGAPVFYFHGFPGSRLDWRLFDGPEVPASGARIIAADRPGFGLSDANPGRKMLDWPADVLELADDLGIGRFAVLGVSGGGPYALACAAAIPDRVTVAGVVCGMGPADAPGMKDGASWTIPGKPALTRKPLIYLFAMGLDRDPDQFVERSKGSLADVDAALLDIPSVAEAYVTGLREAFRDGTGGVGAEAGLYARDWGFSLDGVRAPVKLWHGGLDENVPGSVGRFVADGIPECEATFLEDEGHLTLPRRHIGEILAALSVDPKV